MRLCLIAVCAFAAMPAAEVPGEKSRTHIATLITSFAQKGNTGESFCWQASYHLRDFIPGYLATRDRRWLDQAVQAYDAVVAVMAAGPDGYKGWVGGAIDGRDVCADVIVGDAIVVNHLLKFAEVVLADAELTTFYGEAARRYIALAKHDLIEKWDARGCWHEDGPYGAYTQWDIYCTNKEPTVWTRMAFDGNGVSLPFNKQNSVGECLLKLYRITGAQPYRDRAQKIYAFMKSRMQLFNDCYVWNYWEPFGPWDIDLEKKSAALWMGTHPFRNYQDGEIHQIVEAYNTGVVFDAQDIQRIINTNLKIMWNQDREHPQFANSNSQLPINPQTPEQIKALAEEQAKNAYSKGGKARAGCLWADLAQFDQTIRDLYAVQLRGHPGIGLDYFSKVTLSQKPSFVRSHAQFPVTVFERPWNSCLSLSVGAMLPATVSVTKPAIIICKASQDIDVVITVVSADGQRTVAQLYADKLPGGKDGRAGVLMFTWDGRDPAVKSKATLAPGNYRIRWTGPDGYREFPITITE
ncbi:MAG: hypothetical protein AAB263_03840 [Planctomycetota bacterium]